MGPARPGLITTSSTSVDAAGKGTPSHKLHTACSRHGLPVQGLQADGATSRRHAVAPAGAQQPVVALLGGQAVHLLSLKTRQPVGSLLGSRGATCAAFSPDGLLLYTAGVP